MTTYTTTILLHPVNYWFTDTNPGELTEKDKMEIQIAIMNGHPTGTFNAVRSINGTDTEYYPVEWEIIDYTPLK